ncbi:MAG: hypothetical protein ACE5OZ_25205 [Candidatus Heimdallarchaeota archaeon]
MPSSRNIVLDASVFHGIIFETGIGFKVYLKLLRSNDTIMLSKSLLVHYKDHFQKKIRDPNLVLGRIISGDHCVDNWIQKLHALRKLVIVEARTIEIDTHGKDRVVYDTAFGGACDLIITTNSRHFPIGDNLFTFRIITPSDYLEEQD